MQVFQDRVEFTNADLARIVERGSALEAQRPGLAYPYLLAAAGTNDLARCVPSYTEEDDADTNRAVLNRLQQKAAGSIKLGLDLQGGTHVRQAYVTLDPMTGKPRINLEFNSGGRRSSRSHSQQRRPPARHCAGR